MQAPTIVLLYTEIAIHRWLTKIRKIYKVGVEVSGVFNIRYRNYYNAIYSHISGVNGCKNARSAQKSSERQVDSFNNFFLLECPNKSGRLEKIEKLISSRPLC